LRLIVLSDTEVDGVTVGVLVGVLVGVTVLVTDGVNEIVGVTVGVFVCVGDGVGVGNAQNEHVAPNTSIEYVGGSGDSSKPIICQQGATSPPLDDNDT
jgi:hypothetical protein